MKRSTPFFTFTCPSCGAAGATYSASSVLVVCEYCHSVLVRSGTGVDDTGKKSSLMEDFSPLQLYTTGTYLATQFTIVGVLQIAYDRGGWKEWYLLFDDGTNGWLADFGGQYVITQKAEPLAQRLPFNQLRAGETEIEIKGSKFLACDVRKAVQVKSYARGELPFTLQDDEPIYVADFRSRQYFATLDYDADDLHPTVYFGRAVELKNLRCQNLRSDDEIRATAGRLRGERSAFNCPSCGAQLNWYAGVTEYIVCSSCHTQIQFNEGQMKVAKAHQLRTAQNEETTLKLGEVAYSNGTRWTVIGLIHVAETEPQNAMLHIQGHDVKQKRESSTWYEYLLYNPQKGFTWLVESDREWDIAHTLDVWPDIIADAYTTTPINPKGKKGLKMLYDYGGEVLYAAGAFYWQIEPGDVTYYQDYRYGSGKFSAERSLGELSWSVSKPVTGEELAQWFKRPELEDASQKTDADLSLGMKLFVTYLVLNLPAFLWAWSHFFVFIGTSYMVFWALVGRYRDDDD